MTGNEEVGSISALESLILEMESRTGDLPDWLNEVDTWIGYIDREGALLLLDRNVKPQKGVPGTNRPQIRAAIPEIAKDILGGNWIFNHQGIAFNVKGELVDGQHRLEAFLKATETDPELTIPIMITWNLPLESDEKIDIARRRIPGTFLAKDGNMSANRLATAVKWLHLYDNNNFDTPLNRVHWTQSLDVTTLRAALKRHPLAPEGILIGGQLQALITPSAGGAGWVIARERYTDTLVAEFVEGVKTGANLDAGDPRLAMRNWAINRKDRGARAIAYLHLAYFIKAFNAFRRNENVDTLTYKPTVEKFPRP